MHAMTDHPLRKLRVQANLSREDLANETGVSARTIMRAEQGLGLNPESRRLLCQYFNRSADELGLLGTYVPQNNNVLSRQDAPPLVRIEDMIRRKFLHLLTMASSALILPIDWAQVGATLTQPQQMNSAAIQNLGNINRNFWAIYRTSSQKHTILSDVIIHLDVLIQALSQASSYQQRQSYSLLIADLAQLSGEIFFDSNLYVEASQAYVTAATTAKEAKAYDLWACALVRHSFLHIYDRDFIKALPLLQAAGRAAQQGDSTLATKHWIAMVSAQAYAGTGQYDECQNALDLAEEVRNVKYGGNGTWLRFDADRILEERGACLVKLNRPGQAEPLLHKALQLHPDFSRRRGMVLTDLALSAVEKGDSIEKACRIGDEVIQIAQRGSSGMLKKGLQVLQTQLSPFAQVSAVKRFNEQLVLLKTSN